MRFGVLCVVALVILTAGCSSFGGNNQDTPTLTPAEVPTPTSTPTDGRVGVAPGVSTAGVTHPQFLAERHAAAVRATSYVWTREYHEDRTFGNVTSDLRRSLRIVVENDTVYRRDVSNFHEKSIDGDVRYLAGYSEYADGRAKYTSWLGESGVDRVFRRNSDPSQRPPYATLPKGAIQRYLDLESATVTYHEVPESDRQHYRVTGTRSSLPSVGAVENYSARAVVREDGLVRRLNVSYDAVENARHISASYNFTYREVGTATVTPPDWADEARAEFADD